MAALAVADAVLAAAAIEIHPEEVSPAAAAALEAGLVRRDRKGITAPALLAAVDDRLVVAGLLGRAL